MPKLTQVINSRRGADLAVSTFRMKPAPQKYVPTLRQILGAGFLILTILALFTAFALIYYPKELRVEVDNIHQINENLHMSNLLTANLLKFGKSVRFELNGQQEGLEAQSRIETQILNQIQNLKEKVSTDELRIVSQIESDSNRFLLARKELERKNHVSSSDILQMREALEAALDSVGTFIESDLNLATQTSKRAEKIDLLTDIMGAILIVIFIFGFAVIIFLSRNYLYRPLSQIKNTLSQFSHGDRSARAKIQGARELPAIGSVYNEMAEDLEELERRRFEFLAGFVHDLRNPLSA